MFLSLEDFARVALARAPSVALVTWGTKEAKASFEERLPRALLARDPGTRLSTLSAGEFTGDEVRAELHKRLQNPASPDCLLVRDLELQGDGAAVVLNSLRERLASLRLVVCLFHEGYRRTFLLNAPDLASWVGPLVARAEDLAPPFTLADVEKGIEDFEKRHGVESATFRELRQSGKGSQFPDGWFWMELLAIRDDLGRRGR